VVLAGETPGRFGGSFGRLTGQAEASQLYFLATFEAAMGSRWQNELAVARQLNLRLTIPVVQLRVFEMWRQIELA
jgi:hypothetical protein